MKNLIFLLSLLFTSTIALCQKQEIQIEKGSNTFIVYNVQSSFNEISEILLKNGYFTKKQDSTSLETEYKGIGGLDQISLKFNLIKNNLYVRGLLKGFVPGSGEVSGILQYKFAQKKLFSNVLEMLMEIKSEKLETKKM